MGLMDMLRSIFGGGLTDDEVTVPETVDEAVSDGAGTIDEAADDVTAAADDATAAVDDAGGSAEGIVDENDNGLDDSVDEEMAINAVNADIEAAKEAATGDLLHPGMEQGLR
jgi:hypothetical protein